jgi:hypothetical protein
MQTNLLFPPARTHAPSAEKQTLVKYREDALLSAAMRSLTFLPKTQNQSYDNNYW